MTAKSLDLYVLLKLALEKEQRPYSDIAGDLFMSASEVHASVKRCAIARLIDPNTRRPRRQAMEEYLLHGVRYAFPSIRGSIERGLPTSFAAPPFLLDFSGQTGPIPVWADPEGRERGYSVEPLHPSAPAAARHDPALYSLLAVVDALRDGRARERGLAEKKLKELLDHASVDAA
jgi:hypothetical protein